MFDADRPILKSEQDRLGRAIFAKYLARCILDHHNPESLVVGLYGGWGSGKTSIINLALEELRAAASNMLEDEQPIILNFSPWSYSGQNQLIYSFFRRLSSELRRAPYLKNRSKIMHLLELYVSFFTHQPVPKSLRPKHHFLSRLLHPTRQIEETFGWESGRDLTLVKAELNELLRQQKQKIIIIIDNISRIEDQEITQIFQIVKSMGDYANTVYLLAFDKHHVVRAIDKIYGEGGDELLEKIIQLPFEVPPISKQDLENLLLDRLQQVVQVVPEDSWDKNYWADIYYSTFKYFFENCRDITRYVNTLNFSYQRVKEVVNPVDFFALTALEVFVPQVYYGIRDNKDLFTDLMNSVYRLDAEKLKKEKSRCDEILQRTQRIPQPVLLKLLTHLFPRLHRIYEKYVNYYHSDAIARKNRRICSPDVFDVYFRLSMPTGNISESEMNTLIALAHDEESFTEALLRLNQDDRAGKFLDLLDGAAAASIAKNDIGHIINALLSSGDFIPDGDISLLSFSSAMRIHRIIHQLLRRFDTTKERFTLLQNAINENNKSLYIIIHELNVLGEEHAESEDTFLPVEHRDINSEQLYQLYKLAVNKIEYWAKLGRLSEHPKLIPILEAWKNWGSEEACQLFVAQMVQEDKGLLAFLCAIFAEPIQQAISKLEKNPGWEKYIDTIENFIPIHLLEPHAKAMFEDLSFEKLREREQLALLIFLDLINPNTTKIIPSS